MTTRRQARKRVTLESERMLFAELFRSILGAELIRTHPGADWTYTFKPTPGVVWWGTLREAMKLVWPEERQRRTKLRMILRRCASRHEP